MRKIYYVVLLFCLPNLLKAQQASFTASSSFGCAPHSVQFNNTSTGLSTYYWDFGDGTTSTALNPSHVYSVAGDYGVNLTGFDANSNSFTAQTYFLSVSGFTDSIYSNLDTLCPGDLTYFSIYSVGVNQISWDFGDGTVITRNGGTEHSYSSPGIYTITANVTTDSCGMFTITRDYVVLNNIAPQNTSISLSHYVICPGDELYVWGSNQYDFVIDFGDGNLNSNSTNHVYSTTGIYPISMIIQNGCGISLTHYDTVEVLNNLGFNPNSPIYHQVSPDTACVNSQVDFNTDQGYFDYAWDFGNGFSSTNINAQTQFNSVGSYNYSLTITNGCGNDTTLSGQVVIVNNQPISNVNLFIPLNEVCPGDNLIFGVDELANDLDYSYTWNLGNGNTSNNMNLLHSFDSLGTYPVSVSILNGCGMDTILYDTVVVGNNVPLPSIVNIFAQQQGCVGDELYFVLEPSGMGDITWDFGDGVIGTQTQLVIPPDGAPVDVMFHAYGDTGTYYASYTLVNGCGSTLQDTISMNVGTYGDLSNMELMFLWDLSKPICQGQPIEFLAVGGATYMWDFGDESGILITNSSLAPVYHIYNEPGMYAIKVSSYNGCGYYAEVVENIFIPDSKVILSTNTVMDATCGANDGMAVVSASGGTPPYSYSWSNGDKSVIADSLSSGVYVTTVTDENGCSSEAIATVSDEQGPTILLDNIVNNNCYGDNDGSISVTILGGTPPYQVLWSNGDQTEDVFNLISGPYEIFVTDVNECMALESFNVNQPAKPTLSILTQKADCGGANGSASATINNGTPPYNFIWPNTTGSNNTTAGLSAGVYNLMVIDANTCLLQSEFVINEKTAPAIVVDSVVTGTCSGALSGVYVSTIGGTAPFTFNWSDGSSLEDLENISPGNYVLEVFDQNNCSSYITETVEMTLPSENEICIVTVDTVLGGNMVVWEPVQTIGLDYYNVYKESSQSGLYYLIGTTDADSLSFYHDIFSNPEIRSWRYKISAIDNCGNESELSTEHKTIHLTSNLGVGGVVNLIWDNYEGFTYSTYYVNRYHPSTGWQVIDSLSSNLNSITDPTPPNDSNLVYMISINAPGLCSAQKAQDHNSTRSNRASINAPEETSSTTLVSEFSGSETILYPNPTNGKFTLYFESKLIGKTIEIFDVHGKLLHSVEVQNQGANNDFDISEYENGLYLIKISSEEQVNTIRVIKQ